MKIILKQMFILFITMIPAMIPAVMVMTLCDLINLPEGPVYIVSTNLYSILWLLLYRYSTNHSRKKKLKGLVNTRELRPIEWIRCCLIVLGGSLAFSLFTEWIIDVINLLFGKQVITSDSVGDLIENIPVYWLILCVVIIAPIIEEILFRQLLLENLLPYGTCKAVLLSGVLFGVMHLNAEQSLYVKLAEQHQAAGEEKFCLMTLKGVVYTEKADAGEMLLAVCKENPLSAPVEIGSYRGFRMEVYYDTLNAHYCLNLCGKMKHTVSLGTDALGNLTRIENEIAKFPARLDAAKTKKAETLEQIENAKAEFAKPFPYEAELKEKTERLNALNIELNLDEKDIPVMDAEPEQSEEQPEKRSPALVR